MRTKALLTLLTTGILLATTACAATASAEVSTQTATASTTSAAATSEAGRPPEDENTLTGKVITVSSNEITLALASMPEKGEARGGNGPGGGSPPSDTDGQPPELPEGSAPESPERDASSGSQPSAGAPGGGRGSGMNMEFSDDTTTYSVSDSIVVIKGMGDNEETISLEDLTADDIIRFEINGSEQITQIRLMEEDEGNQRQNPPSGESSSAE